MHQKTYKLIGIQPSIDTMMSRHLPVKFCNSAQQLIPGRYAKYVINQFKILDIRTDDITPLTRILPQEFPHALIEILLTVDTRQLVILELINHGRGLPQMNNAGDPV